MLSQPPCPLFRGSTVEYLVLKALWTHKHHCMAKISLILIKTLHECTSKITYRETPLHGHLWKWRHIHTLITVWLWINFFNGVSAIFRDVINLCSSHFVCSSSVCPSKHRPGMVLLRFGQHLELVTEDKTYWSFMEPRAHQPMRDGTRNTILAVSFWFQPIPGKPFTQSIFADMQYPLWYY